MQIWRWKGFPTDDNPISKSHLSFEIPSRGWQGSKVVTFITVCSGTIAPIGHLLGIALIIAPSDFITVRGVFGEGSGGCPPSNIDRIRIHPVGDLPFIDESFGRFRQ